MVLMYIIIESVTVEKHSWPTLSFIITSAYSIAELLSIVLEDSRKLEETIIKKIALVPC